MGAGAGFLSFLGQKGKHVTFTAPVFSVGWIIALVVLLFALILGFMGMLPKEWVLAIAAVCAVRL